jgi:hypothetical protein
LPPGFEGKTLRAISDHLRISLGRAPRDGRESVFPGPERAARKAASAGRARAGEARSALARWNQENARRREALLSEPRERPSRIPGGGGAKRSRALEPRKRAPSRSAPIRAAREAIQDTAWGNREALFRARTKKTRAIAKRSYPSRARGHPGYRAGESRSALSR